MKRFLVTFLLIPILGFSQYTAIPDQNFEQALVDLGHDDIIDGQVLTANINFIDSLDVSGSIDTATSQIILPIHDLTGLQSFTSLVYLDCNGNFLKNLDLSQNNLLSYLNVSDNDLYTLDISHNPKLSKVYCQNNNLFFLDLSQTPKLDSLNCSNNELICLNLKNGNNSNISGINSYANSGLSCIEVDDSAFSNANWTTNQFIFWGSTFNTFCNNNSYCYESVCHPSSATTYLDLNNISALIENGGSMWTDRDYNDPAYEAPKGSGETVLYAGSIWIGGVDSLNQLHLSGLKHRNRESFWSGPLKTNDASTNYFSCKEFDRVWKIDKWQVEEFKIKSQDPSYTVPEVILNWPGNGNSHQNYAQNLAPYHDENSDGVYNSSDGDYPKFNLDNGLPCDAPQLFGDQCIYYIMNDAGSYDSETGAESIGAEIHVQAFAFRGNEYLDNSTFYNYKIINRSAQNYNDFYFGNFVDSDIGCYQDDYIGCDVSRGLSFGFNGDTIDHNCQNPIIGPPPAIGIDFIRGPFKDFDGIDNPLTSNVYNAYNSGGIPYNGLGYGYGDGIIDNERLGMQRFIYFDYTLNNVAMADPQSALDFYRYMQGYWRDNTPLYYGGNGHQQSSPAPLIRTNYCFPGESDPLNWGTVSAGSGVTPLPFSDWAEKSPTGPGSTPNFPGDRRMLQSVGPITFNSGDTADITFAVIYAKDTLSSDPYESVEKMKLLDDSIQTFSDNCFQSNSCLELVNNFQYQNKGLIYHFAYEMEADAYTWSFGDGGISNERFPKHTYASNGNYNVCITAEIFNCGTVTHCNTIQDVSVQMKIEKNIKIYPNPTENLIQIEIENHNGTIVAELYDFTGKLLETTNKTAISLADYPTGIYLLKVSYGDRMEEVKVVKE